MNLAAPEVGWAPGLGDGQPEQDDHATPRRGRWAGTVLALLLMLLGAVGAAWFGSGEQGRVEVVALARDLPRGHLLEPGDLAVLRVAGGGGPARLTSPAAAGQVLVGHQLLLDLAAGTLVSPEMVGSAAPPAGQVTLGVQLPAAALPSSSLRAGERVDVVGSGDPRSGSAGVPAVLARAAQVAEVHPLAGGDTVVYLLLPEAAAPAVVAAASGGGVRLLGVGTGPA